MLTVDENGIVVNHPKINLTGNNGKFNVRNSGIKNRPNMGKVNGIVVHQTGEGHEMPNLFNTAGNPKANFAHFLIDKEGNIYQTISLYRVAYHVGILKNRCILEKKCTDVDIQKKVEEIDKTLSKDRIGVNKWGRESNYANYHKAIESKKKWPERFVSNVDSIGIELHGKSWKVDGKADLEYEPITEAQKESLEWLLRELRCSFHLGGKEIFRHPEISYKERNEAISTKEVIENAKNYDLKDCKKTEDK